MADFRCVICTPTEKLFDEDVYYANVPSEDGAFGVLAGHELLVALTGTGGLCTITINENSGEKREFLIFKGASQMFSGILTILASFGIETKDIDREKVNAHKEELKEMMAESEGKEDTQNKTRMSILKRQMEWDDFQLAYLDKQNAA